MEDSYVGLVAKRIHATRRGRLFGISSAIGGVIGVAGAMAALLAGATAGWVTAAEPHARQA
jgi:hypothetical protein